jgi:hypothetical protein
MRSALDHRRSLRLRVRSLSGPAAASAAIINPTAATKAGHVPIHAITDAAAAGIRAQLLDAPRAARDEAHAIGNIPTRRGAAAAESDASADSPPASTITSTGS